MKKLWLIRKDQEAVSPVIATILMVAITVVLAAVLYVMVSGLLGGGTGGTKPVITFNANVPVEGTAPNRTATVTLAGVGEPVSAFSAFKGQISKDGSTLVTTAVTLASNTVLSFGSTVKVIIRDLAGEGKLTQGDSIFVYSMGGVGFTGTFRFSLIWGNDGSEIQSASWTI